MDLAWGEGESVALYNRLDLDPSEPVSPFRIARKMFGPECITRTPILMAAASTAIVNGRRIIAVRRSVPVEYQGFFVAHEIAHTLMQDAHYEGDDEDQERMADYLGACIVCPAPAARELYKQFGRDFEAISDELGSTQTFTALRLAEVRRIPRIIVTPKKVYDRLPEEWSRPSPAEMRKLATSNRPGLTKMRLTDAPGRIVVDVDEAI